MKIKITSTFISFFFLTCFANAQTNWLWAKNAGGSGCISECHSVSANYKGNVYVTGFFQSASITFGTTTLTNAGGRDIFIAKYDSAGNVIWAKNAGGSNYDEGNSVAADSVGNVYLTGNFFSPSIIFGTTTLINADPSGNTSDLFVVKYDSLGNVVWAKSAGSSYDDNANAITSTASGNIFVTGTFYGPTITFEIATLTNSCFRNAFIVSYDTSGNVSWAKSPTGPSIAQGWSVSVDASGNAFITGNFQTPTITFDWVTLTNADPSGNTNDLFIAKYNSGGVLIWAKSVGAMGYEKGFSVSADPFGNVFVTGNFTSSTIAFANTILYNASPNNEDVFIAKYGPSGNVLWAKSAGGSGFDQGFSVSSDLSGNVFLSGQFNSSSITFGTSTLTVPQFVGHPMFIVKYDGNGNVICSSALLFGGDFRNGVSADPFGNAYFGSYFFGNSFNVGSDVLSTVGNTDIFISKFRANCNDFEGVDEIESEESISIFPNPSYGAFNLRSNEKVNSISVFDVLGNKIYESKTDLQEINISNDSPGIYFLQIETEKGRVTKKIVKE